MTGSVDWIGLAVILAGLALAAWTLRRSRLNPVVKLVLLILAAMVVAVLLWNTAVALRS